MVCFFPFLGELFTVLYQEHEESTSNFLWSDCLLDLVIVHTSKGLVHGCGDLWVITQHHPPCPPCTIPLIIIGIILECGLSFWSRWTDQCFLKIPKPSLRKTKTSICSLLLSWSLALWYQLRQFGQSCHHTCKESWRHCSWYLTPSRRSPRAS